ncbi:MAG: efflux RND transporter periplasmic adaptor subunit [Magnetococcales bacterium]|nr:efflux RND transporter periplasmic adaptor subunit [Magnetococcales bacterium]
MIHSNIRWRRVLTPLLVLVAALAVAMVLIKTAPEPKRRPQRSTIPTVEVLTATPAPYTVTMTAYGTVTPRTQSTLVAEASGRIIHMATSFRNGGFFKAGELLARIDPSEYRLARANIEASLQGVEARLAELEVNAENLKKSLVIEKRRLQLAQRQYQRHKKLQQQGAVSKSVFEQSDREYLSRRASQTTLNNTLRLVPAQRQTLQAEMRLKSAQLEDAELNLARTEIRAPYDGRVLEKKVDLGQSVSGGSVLGLIYALDAVEIRLPISQRQAAFLDLEERQQDGIAPVEAIPVTLQAGSGAHLHIWRGGIVRTEGSIDTRTRQHTVIAQVEHPYAPRSDGGPPLRVGQFVQARIQGRVLNDAFILPRQALRSDDQVIMVTPEQRIERRRLTIIWRDVEHVVVMQGLKAGEQIAITPLPYAVNGSKVRLKGESKRPSPKRER